MSIINIINPGNSNVSLSIKSMNGTIGIISTDNDSSVINNLGEFVTCLSKPSTGGGDGGTDPDPTPLSAPTDIKFKYINRESDYLNIYPSDGLSSDRTIPMYVFFDDASIGDQIVISSPDYGVDKNSIFYSTSPFSINITSEDITKGYVKYEFQPRCFNSDIPFDISGSGSNSETVTGAVQAKLIRSSTNSESEYFSKVVRISNMIAPKGDVSWGVINHHLEHLGNIPDRFPIYRIKNNGDKFAYVINGESEVDSIEVDSSTHSIIDRNISWSRSDSYFEYKINAIPSNIISGPIFGTNNAPYPYLGFTERDTGVGMSYIDSFLSGSWTYGAVVGFDGKIYYNDKVVEDFCSRNLQVGDVIGVSIEPSLNQTRLYFNGVLKKTVPLARKIQYSIDLPMDQDRTYAIPNMILENDGSIVDLCLFPDGWSYPENHKPFI